MQTKEENSRKGWVKLPRRLLDWKHIKNINAVYLYAYLLLSVDMETGSVKVSIRGLADKTGLSVQNVRTLLNLLEREGLVTRELTQEVTQKLTQGTSVITICDCDTYSTIQNNSQHSDQHGCQHSDQHSLQKGFPPTPPFLKNRENINNNINNNIAREKDVLADEVHNCYAKQEMALKSLGMIPADLPKFIALAEDIMQEWELTNADDWTWRHLINHARIKIRRENGNQRKADNNAADSGPDAFTRYFAQKEFERRAKDGVGHVS